MGTPGAELERLVDIMRRLRAEGGCHWDREQDLRSMRPYLTEEAFEVLDEMDRVADGGPWRALCEELGDLLFQIVFHARLAEELGEFSMADVSRSISDKLTSRHPHVFGERQADGTPQPLANWAKLKAEERKKKIAFTRETFPTRTVVLTRRPSLPVTSLDELRALRVGTIRGSSMAEAVARAGVPPANVDDGVKPGGLPEALAAGRVKAVLLGIESAITAQRDDPAIELGMFVGAPGSLAFGVRLGDTELRAALDGYIENVRKTATWNRLAVKYFGESAPEVLRKARE